MKKNYFKPTTKVVKMNVKNNIMSNPIDLGSIEPADNVITDEPLF